MSHLNRISQETKEVIRKFRLNTSRTDKIACLPIKIEPSPSYEIVISEDEKLEMDEDLTELSDLAEILPDNTPRFVLMAYPLVNKDGIKQAPLILLYWKPQTVVSAEWKMLYAGASEMVKQEVGTYNVIEVTSGLEDEDDVEELIEEIESSK